MVLNKKPIQWLKNGLFALVLGFAWTSCDMKKGTKVEFTNENSYPVSFKIQANNIEFSMLDVQPGERVEGLMDWTEIEKKDGYWIFWVTNPTKGIRDSFAHGSFIAGELCNFLHAESKGTQLKVNLNE